MSDGVSGTRRIELVLARPRASLHVGVRPTVVVGGRGQPAQWGVGTWSLPTDGAVLGVYLFNRLWRYGAAEIALPPDTTRVVYRPPRLPVGRGRLTATGVDDSRG